MNIKVSITLPNHFVHKVVEHTQGQLSSEDLLQRGQFDGEIVRWHGLSVAQFNAIEETAVRLGLGYDGSQTAEYVYIDLPNHPMHGCIAEIFGRDADGLVHVMAVGSSISGWFRPDDLQKIERGSRVLIEVTVSDFFQDSMMVGGGWMPLSRIHSVVAPTDDRLSSQQAQ